MSTVAIAAVGSRGDVSPLAGVGVALQRAGHRVVVAAYTPFAELITGWGLEFRELPVDFTPGADHVEGSAAKSIAQLYGPNGLILRQTGEALVAALREEPVDVLLLPPLAELVGHPLAEAKGIPSLGVRLQPVSATSAHPPTVLGSWSAGAVGNRLAAGLGAWAIDRLYGGVVARFRRELGLPKNSARRLRRRRTHANWPILHGYSPSVLPRPADWRSGLEVVGYWWSPAMPDWQPPQLLTDFLAAGPAPVFVGLGSTVVSAARAEHLADVVAGALRQAGTRGIIQSGWAGLEVSGDDVLTIGEAPHDWLFPQLAAVAHHCGAGTTAAALRAGVPTIALPGPAGDQPFWARRLGQLGASAATIPQRALSADRLADAMRTAVTDGGIRSSARRLASLVAGEDGTARVVAAVERLLSHPQEHHGC
jgi:sterol 3beta-glucosyltransferase